MQKALVTGGAGFVGSHLVDTLLEKGVEVVVLDDLSNGNLANLPKDNPLLTIMQGSILDTQILPLAMRNVDTVFHEAAIVEVNNPNSSLTMKVNEEGSKYVLHYALDAGVKHIILASSAAVYGRSEQMPRKETSVTLPTSAYGESKLRMEKAAYDYDYSKTKITILRNFNIYGLRATNKRYSGVINIFASSLLHDQPCIIYGDGRQTRDFTHISDILQANMLVVEKQESLFEIYNVGTGIETTVNQLLSLEAEIFNKRPEVAREAPRAGDVYRNQADISKIHKLGYEPKVAFRDGLEDYLRKQYLEKVAA